ARRRHVDPDLAAAVALLQRVGLHDDIAALVAAARARHGATQLRDVRLQQWLQHLRQAGLHHRAWRLSAALRPTALHRWPTAATAWQWRALHPRPWRGAVQRAALQAGVDQALIYAIMRQESRFDPEAKSPAGAVGLMQLMPRTAATLAARAGKPAPTTAALQQPARSLHLASRLLAELRQDFHGCLPLMVAAYNAGAPAVHRWLKAHGAERLDRFVESIPWRETRNYTRRVLTHHARYRHLAGKPVWQPVLQQSATACAQ
ncbi:MAG: lytic transglycosylase domain-containing protein, partial [Polyangiales bacterium]